ncbi:MAG: Gfo/Idh/MocA family protein, partial [Thermoprotei archaeon]
MAPTGDEAYSMYKAAQKNGKVLEVGFQTRYNPQLIAAKKFVDAGFLGKPYFAEAVGFRHEGDRRRGIPGETFTSMQTAGGGVILDEGVYALDYPLYLLGHPNPVSVSGLTYAGIGKDETAVGAFRPTYGGTWDPKKFEVEDFAAAFIRFENDLVFQFKRSWAMHAETLGRPLILGTKGGLSLDPLTLYTDMNGYMVNIEPAHLPSSPDEESRWFYQKVYDFLVAVRDGTNPPIETKGIVKMHYIIDGIYLSSKLGQEVKINLPADLR